MRDGSDQPSQLAALSGLSGRSAGADFHASAGGISQRLAEGANGGAQVSSARVEEGASGAPISAEATLGSDATASPPNTIAPITTPGDFSQPLTSAVQPHNCLESNSTGEPSPPSWGTPDWTATLWPFATRRRSGQIRWIGDRLPNRDPAVPNPHHRPRPATNGTQETKQTQFPITGGHPPAKKPEFPPGRQSPAAKHLQPQKIVREIGSAVYLGLRGCLCFRRLPFHL